MALSYVVLTSCKSNNMVLQYIFRMASNYVCESETYQEQNEGEVSEKMRKG